MYGMSYNHYFLKTGPKGFIIEFHGTSHFEASFEIHNQTVHDIFYVEPFSDGTNTTPLTQEMILRLKNVLLILRSQLIL